MVPRRGNFKMCKNWNMSEKTVPILFVGDGFLSLCITSYLPFRPTLLGDFPACCGRRNASPTPLQIENLAENSVSILFVGDGFLSLCIAVYLPLCPTLLGDFPACCGRRNASPTPLQIPNLRTTERYRAGGAARSESKS